MNASDSVNEELAQAIEQLYETFAKYPLRSAFQDRCSPLGERQELAVVLGSVPLRALEVGPLATYAFKALLTMGDEQDLKYFLPRILELYARCRDWHDHAGAIFDKLREAHWKDWEASERLALERYVMATWHELLRTFPGVLTIYEYLADLVAAEFDTSLFLASWDPATSVCAARRAAQLIAELDYTVARVDASSPVSKHQRPLGSAIDAWLVNQAVEEKLKRAFFEHADEDFAVDLARAADRLWCVAPVPAT